MRVRTTALVCAGVVAASLVAAVPPSAQAATDTTAPVLTAVSAVATTVTAGSPVAIRFTAKDDVAVKDVTGTLTGPGGITVPLLTAGGDWPWIASVGGPVVGVVPRGAPAGSYTLDRITVYDTANNYTDYSVGSPVSVPAGSPAALDIAPATVTVLQPGTPDTTGPTLSSFAMESPTDRRLGEFVTWSYAAADDSPVREVRVFVRKPSNEVVQTSRGGGDLRSGRISLWLPTDEETGTWTVTGVLLTDSSGNTTSRSLDGTDLPTQSFTVSAGDIRPDDIRVFDEYPDPLVALKVPSGPLAIGTTATLSGSVSFMGAPVPNPVLALYRTSGGVTSFAGLLTGAANGTWSTTVAVKSTARYRTWFLGSDLATSRVPSRMGGSALLPAGVKQKLTVAATTVTVPAGSTGRLVVTLSPKRSGATVVLRRWNGSSWVAVRSVVTRSDGKASTSVPRPRSGSVKYRWTTAYDGKGLAATSATVTVRR